MPVSQRRSPWRRASHSWQLAAAFWRGVEPSVLMGTQVALSQVKGQTPESNKRRVKEPHYPQSGNAENIKGAGVDVGEKTKPLSVIFWIIVSLLAASNELAEKTRKQHVTWLHDILF